MAVVEAMAHGVTVICSDTCGAAFCAAEAGGIPFPEGDSHALAEALRAVFAEPGRLAESGQAAYRYVKEQLSFECYRGALNDLLRKEFRSELRI